MFRELKIFNNMCMSQCCDDSIFFQTVLCYGLHYYAMDYTLAESIFTQCLWGTSLLHHLRIHTASNSTSVFLNCHHANCITRTVNMTAQSSWKFNIKVVNIKGRFHRLGLTPQLANPRLRDNRGLSPVCVPSSSVNLTAHLTRDLTSFR